MIQRITLILTIVSALTAQAQHQSQLGRFAIDYDLGCAPLTISVTALGSTADLEGIQYEYEEGVEFKSDTFHTYGNSGDYRIVQIQGDDVTPKTDTLFFTLRAPDAPRYDLFYCSATDFTVSSSDTNYDFLRIKFDNTDSVDLLANQSITYSFPSGSGMLSVKGFYDDAFPNCGEETNSLNLNEINATQPDQMDLINGCLGQDYLRVLGTGLNENHLYQLAFAIDDASFQVVHTGLVPNGESLYPVTTNSGDSICIQLRTLNACDSTTLFVTEQCSVIESFTSLNASYASYSGRDVTITSGNVPGLLELYQSLDENYLFTSTFNGSTTTPPISNFRPTRYKIVEIDTCGNRYDSAFVSPPFLTLTDKDLQTNELSFSLQAPTNDLGTPEDSILLYNEDSTTTLTLPYSSSVKIPSNIGEFIKIRSQHTYSNGTNVYSNELQTDVNILVYVPGAFTPNGDGLNDELIIFGLPTTNFQILIFDRWGNVIHQANQNPVWNGKDGKDKVNEGNYLYKLSFELESGELKSQVGTFTILRN